MNNNSLGNTKTSNTIEVYVYDESPDGRPLLKSKSEYDVSVTKYITSSYESIQSDSKDHIYVSLSFKGYKNNIMRH